MNLSSYLRTGIVEHGNDGYASHRELVDEKGFNFMTLHLNGADDDEQQLPLGAPFMSHDLLFGAMDWSQSVVGDASRAARRLAAASRPAAASGAADDGARAYADAEAAFLAACSFAAHLSLPAIMLPALDDAAHARDDAVCLARAAAVAHRAAYAANFWLRVRDIERADTYALWTRFRTVSDGGGPGGGASSCAAFVFAALELPAAAVASRLLTVAADADANVARRGALAPWLGERVAALIVPSSAFVRADGGAAPPLLCAAHQHLVRLFVARQAAVLLDADDAFGRANPALLRQSLAFTCGKLEPLAVSLTANGRALSMQATGWCAPYFDALQSPLQPLQDHLTSSTYETFERDGTKYAQYQRALAAAFSDQPPAAAADGALVVMVLGAGRGPLVRAALRAADQATPPRAIRVYAVEKNPNAAVTLRALKQAMGWSDALVSVVCADMRAWRAPELADVVVSELLGSFGDNEAAPECVRGALHLLRRGSGVAIPRRCTSYMAPVCSPRLYGEVVALSRAANADDAAAWEAGGGARSFETPYVVAIHEAHELAAPLAAFDFVDEPLAPHAARDALPPLSRRATLDFSLAAAAATPAAAAGSTLHGFACYFDAQLYGDVHISTLPSTHTPDMTSWFPLFLPLRAPVAIRAADRRIRLHLWRQSDGRRLWYEWALSEPECTPTHNAHGQAYHIGL